VRERVGCLLIVRSDYVIIPPAVPNSRENLNQRKDQRPRIFLLKCSLALSDVVYDGRKANIYDA